jgi:hypothetical protein
VGEGAGMRGFHTSIHQRPEVQVWLKFAVKGKYLEVDLGRNIYATYNQILGSLVKMINEPDSWLI